MATAQTMCEVSADWYQGRTELGWIRHDTAGAAGIFARHGLTGPFWELD